MYMEKLFTTSAIVKLPLDLPEAAVWSRLGRNRFLSRITPEQEVECKLSMLRALNVITPCGRWKLLKILPKSELKRIRTEYIEKYMTEED